MSVVFYPGVTVERDVYIPMRDSIHLCADIYRPQETGTKFPILLMRLPYGREIASTVAYRHPSWYAQQGYIVVIQEVRGCGDSEGVFYPFRWEYRDAVDTIAWCLSEIPENNGRVGMYGFSYQGLNQFQAAVMQPQGLVTICPAMAGADLFLWLYWGGAFCWEFAFTWALQLAQLQSCEPLATQLWQAQQNVPQLLRSTLPRDFPPLTASSPGQFYVDWLNSRTEVSWEYLHPISRFHRYDLPALHIGGWYDPFIDSIWQTYERACAATKKPQKLIIGPWQHFPWGQRVGELDFGSEASRSVDELQIAWFDFWLKDIDNGIATQQPHLFFVMGKNTWTTDLNCTGTLTYHLSDGKLDPHPPSQAIPSIYVYEPWNPTPSTPYAPHDQRQINDRWDCVSFWSDVLEEKITIGGKVECHLEASTTALDTDWVLKLLDGYPDGREMLVTMGVLRASYGGKRAEDTEAFLYRIVLRPTCHCFSQGHRIGVVVSSAAFPLIERHSNIAGDPSITTPKQWRAATQLIFPTSKLCLPLLPSQ
ncbi:MAG: CocE/NonD family hydrolase [Pseudanabaenaceae cyanobacterium]